MALLAADSAQRGASRAPMSRASEPLSPSLEDFPENVGLSRAVALPTPSQSTRKAALSAALKHPLTKTVGCFNAGAFLHTRNTRQDPLSEFPNRQPSGSDVIRSGTERWHLAKHGQTDVAVRPHHDRFNGQFRMIPNLNLQRISGVDHLIGLRRARFFLCRSKLTQAPDAHQIGRSSLRAWRVLPRPIAR